MKKTKFLKLTSLISLVYFLPIITFAACTYKANPKIGDLFNYITCIIGSSIIPVLFTLALVVFIWGVIQYVINTGEEKKKAEGKQFIIWGIIALAVMVSVWGLVSILTNTFDLTDGGVKVIPQLRTKY
ncbi:MAG: hypothetical protein WCX46_01785 [Candidatus Paceibacterota bacterium]